MKPNFGYQKTNFRGVELTCKYVAPGLTMQDLIKTFNEAEKEYHESDTFAGNPMKWKNNRGIAAVTDAIINAIYQKGNQ